MHRLTLQLLALDSAAERIERLRVSLRRDFSVYSAARVPDSRQRRSRTLQSPPARGPSAPARRRRHRGIGRARRGRAGRGASAGRRPLIACRLSQLNRVAGDARQQVFPRGCRRLKGVAGKSFSQEAAMADGCGRRVVFPRGRSVTSERTGNAMARLQPVFPKTQPSRRNKPLHRRKDVPVAVDGWRQSSPQACERDGHFKHVARDGFWRPAA